jgi:hypothetical protein
VHARAFQAAITATAAATSSPSTRPGRSVAACGRAGVRAGVRGCGGAIEQPVVRRRGVPGPAPALALPRQVRPCVPSAGAVHQPLGRAGRPARADGVAVPSPAHQCTDGNIGLLVRICRCGVPGCNTHVSE